MTIISSPDPIERVLEPGDKNEGYFEVNEDVKCVINVRAARMFPFWRHLKIGGLGGYGFTKRGNQGRTGEYREEQNGLDSCRKTNPPSFQLKPSHYPVYQRPKGGVRPRRTRPLVFDHPRYSD